MHTFLLQRCSAFVVGEEANLPFLPKTVNEYHSDEEGVVSISRSIVRVWPSRRRDRLLLDFEASAADAGPSADENHDGYAE